MKSGDEATNSIMLGIRLKALREASRMTQAEVSARLKCWPSQISCYESGKYVPNLFTFFQMLKLYKVSADAVMGWLELPEV